PDLPGVRDGRAEAAMRALGLDYAEPVRLERSLLSADRRDLPDLRRTARGHRVGGVRAGQRPAVRALRHPLRLRAFGGVRGGVVAQGEREEHGVVADGLIFACAMTVEERIAR